jgi:hypothetical protein
MARAGALVLTVVPTLLPTKMSPSPSFASGLVMPVGQWHVNGTPSLAPWAINRWIGTTAATRAGTVVADASVLSNATRDLNAEQDFGLAAPPLTA